MLNNKNILITGGAGFIGSNLAKIIKKRYPKSNLIILDIFRENKAKTKVHFSYGHFKNLLDVESQIICGDIRDKKFIKRLGRKYKFDYIVHLAAISDTTIYNQKLVLDINVNSLDNIIKLLTKSDAKLVYASSGAVYGNEPVPNKVGNEKPLNIYGFSKLSMDNYLKDFYTQFSITGLRFFNVYGPGEWFKGGTSSVILQLAMKMIVGEDAVLFYNSDKIYRDFVYIDDVTESIILAMMNNGSGIFNVGTGKSRSFLDLFKILKNELKYNKLPKYTENPYIGKYQWETKADIELTKKILNYKPIVNLEQGIKIYVREIQKFDTH